MGFEPKKSKMWSQYKRLWIFNHMDTDKRTDKTEAIGGSYVNILIYTIFQTVTFYLN